MRGAERAPGGERPPDLQSLVLFFVGIILGLQMAYVMGLLGGGAQIFVPRVISVSIIRELGPLLTAIVMTGRMGAAIAAELGTMVVNEEIMALETSALSPVRFLVVPRHGGGVPGWCRR